MPKYYAQQPWVPKNLSALTPLRSVRHSWVLRLPFPFSLLLPLTSIILCLPSLVAGFSFLRGFFSHFPPSILFVRLNRNPYMDSATVLHNNKSLPYSLYMCTHLHSAKRKRSRLASEKIKTHLCSPTVQQCSMSACCGDRRSHFEPSMWTCQLLHILQNGSAVLLHYPLTYHCFCPHLILSRSLCRCHHHDHDHHCHPQCQSFHLMIVSSRFVCWCLEALTPLSCTVFCCCCDHTHHHSLLTHSVFDLCPLSPRQQTDQWE